MGAEEQIGGPDHNELIIAVVAAVGTDVGMVVDEIKMELSDYEYEAIPLRLSDYLAEEADEDFFKVKPFDEALWSAMTAGDDLRNKWGRGDALALHAISDIVAERNQRGGIETSDEEDAGSGADLSESDIAPPLDRVAFVLRSLKTQDELTTLRGVYGPRLRLSRSPWILVAVGLG